MGKESKLRRSHEEGETRASYSNGDRKLYDRDSPPNGTDEYVWNLALYFEQQANNRGWSVEGRPILYTELYNRVRKDQELFMLINDGNNDLIDFIIEMIDYYFENYSSNKKPSINDFCNYDNFITTKTKIHANRFFKELKEKGQRLVVTYPAPLPDKRPSCVIEALDIANTVVYTEQEQQERFAAWKQRED